MKVDGLILAGGKSRRMGGGHKGGLIYHEQTFQEHVIKEFEKEADTIFLSYASQIYDSYPGCRIVMDEMPGIGPMGGLYVGLKNSGQEMLMVAACDMPRLDIEIYRQLYKKLTEEEKRKSHTFDGVVPVTEGKMHPLAAIYRKRALHILKEQINVQNYRMTDAVKKMDIFYVDLSQNQVYAKMLCNINTMEEYLELVKG